MKRLFCLLATAASLLLTACASTVNSEVTAFHAWPAALPDKSFVFAPDPQQQDALQYQHYAQLIREQLLRLGFSDAQNGASAALKISFHYGMQTGTLVLTQPDPFYYGPRYGRRGPFRTPIYDPFWAQPMQQTAVPVFARQLHVVIERNTNGETLYEVTVDSAGYQGTLSMAMPYMVRSAFADFPGPSGVSRHIEMKID